MQQPRDGVGVHLNTPAARALASFRIERCVHSKPVIGSPAVASWTTGPRPSTPAPEAWIGWHQRRHGGCGQEQAGRGHGVRAVEAQWCCDSKPVTRDMQEMPPYPCCWASKATSWRRRCSSAQATSRLMVGGDRCCAVMQYGCSRQAAQAERCGCHRGVYLLLHWCSSPCSLWQEDSSIAIIPKPAELTIAHRLGRTCRVIPAPIGIT